MLRIIGGDETLRAWAFVDEAAGDARVQRSGIFADVAFGVKDIIDVRGMPTRLGLPGDGPPAKIDAWCVAALRAAGAVPVGKTHTTAFAWQDPAPTFHPHAAGATPGGSSAGSAAAVAASHVGFALATQTVGSTLRPAAYCGVVGYKPTYGTIPVFGVSPLAASLDTVGVIARDVATAATFASIFGIDALPAASGLSALGPHAPPRLAFAPAAFADAVSQDVRTAVAARVLACERAGATVERVALPEAFFEAFDRLEPLIAFEAHAVHGPSRNVELPPKLADLLSRGAGVPSSARTAALAFRKRTYAQIEASVAAFDAVLLVVADVAPSRDTTGDGRPQGSATFYGLPAITIPIGRTRNDLPIGIQLIGRRGADASLLAAAAWLERLHPSR